MPQDIHLRQATPEDLTVARGFYFETQRWLIEHYFGWDEALEIEKFPKQYDISRSKIIVIDGVDAGWLQTREDEQTVGVDGIYVTKKFQGQGIGTDLLKSIIDDAEKRCCFEYR